MKIVNPIAYLWMLTIPLHGYGLFINLKAGSGLAVMNIAFILLACGFIYTHSSLNPAHKKP